MLPKVSVITAVYNGEEFLEATIKSIINQKYENLEYIVIDGKSSDGSVDIIKKYQNKIAYFHSKKDKGISDAFNQGLRVATGDYINFQGDGDGFVNDEVLLNIFKNVDKQKDMIISTKIARVNKKGEVLYYSKHCKNFKKQSLLFRMSLAHQGLFIHKDFYKQYGLFDVDNVFCMDYEHLLRAYKNFPKVVCKDIVSARWRDDGLGNGRALEIFSEYDKIKRDNKVANCYVLDFIKYWTLFKFYIKQIFKK